MYSECIRVLINLNEIKTTNQIYLFHTILTLNYLTILHGSRSSIYLLNYSSFTGPLKLIFRQSSFSWFLVERL